MMSSSVGARAPGLHTPTQSFSGSPAETMTPGPSVGDKKSRSREEADHIKQRLSDQRFNMRDYPDPLLPRDTSSESHMPKGVTAENEKHLLDIISKFNVSRKIR